MQTSIAVIGAGNGGSAIAAYLSSVGVRVNLCDLFPEYLKSFEMNNGIELILDGKISHQSLNMITTDIPAAIKDVLLIMVVTPSFTHKMIAHATVSALCDNQIVILNPGRTGGALEFLETIRIDGCRADITVAEAQTLVYSCRRTSGASVEIYGVKKIVDLGALPAIRTQNVLDALHLYYPQFRSAKNCLSTGLSNIGALFHPVPVLLNIGRIENDKNGYRYYWDGISPSVAKLVHKIDEERIAVAQAYKTEVPSAEEWLKQTYGTDGNDLYSLIQNNDAYRDIRAPRTIQTRYVTEDVPMSLVPISELGRIACVATPNINAIITLTSSIYDHDFRYEGRSAKNLGIEGMTKEQVAHYFETGEK